MRAAGWTWLFFGVAWLGHGGVPTGNSSPAENASATRVKAWQDDLSVLSDSLLGKDRSFSSSARQGFQRERAELERSLPSLTDDAILVGLSRLVALAGNAHTRFRLDPTHDGAFSTQFPIRIWFFQDGPYVIRTSTEYRRALGCRLLSINGQAIAQVKKSVSQLFAGNAPWTDYLAPIYLESPNVLHGLGITASNQEATFTFEDTSGTRFELVVRSCPINQTWETWQELSPVFQAAGELPMTALDPRRVPLYLSHPDRAYWFEYFPGEQAFYFQFNVADNAADGPMFKEFSDSLLSFVGTHPIRTTIVDLRLNSGGNLEVARDFMNSLGNNATINRAGHLFVITGRSTFSAGLYHAAQLKQFTHATFVGEPVGDALDYWAEGSMIVLPHSEAIIEYADGFHRYSLKEYPENRPYYATLRIRNLSPDIPVALSARDYVSGRDPALEKIMVPDPR